MNKKKQSKGILGTPKLQKISKPKGLHREPPSHRLDNFNPMNITESKRKLRKDRVSSISQTENYSGTLCLL